MRATFTLFVGLVVSIAIASPAAAIPVQYLSIDWDSSRERTINFLFNGGAMSVDLSPATGHLDYVLDSSDSPGGRTLSRIFCVDVFNDAFDRIDATHNREYAVHEYNEADGTTGWTTPAGDSDHWRDLGSLTRTAWLVNTYGRGALTADQRVALNVVIWQAAYGSRFSYVSGLDAAQTIKYNEYLAAYNLGGTDSNYKWYDNNFQDTDDRFQDFMEAVPEPGTMMLLGSGLLGSGLIFRRRRK